MARPSVGLQTLKELAATAKRDKQRDTPEPPGETRSEKNHSGNSNGESTHEVPTRGTFKVAVDKPNQPQKATRSRRNTDIGTLDHHSLFGSSMDHELSQIQRRYALQNQALAKNNSVLLSRISEMEARLSNVVNENMTLRTLRNTKDLEVRKEVGALLRYVELEVLGKVGEICHILASVRDRDNLPENPVLRQVELLLTSSVPTTSTPLEGTSRPDMLQEFHELELAFPRPADFKGSLVIPEAQLTNAKADIAHVTLDSSSDEANQTVIEGITPGVSSAPPSRPSTTVLCDNEGQAGEPRLLADLAGYTETESSDKEEARADKLEESAPEVPKTRPTRAVVKKQKQPARSVKKSGKPKTEVPKKAEVKFEPESPPRRARKVVSYVEAPLNTKMRRQSAKMMDAVVEVKQEPVLEPALSPVRARPKRRALADVTNNSRPAKKGKSIPANEHGKASSEPRKSVYDFTDTNEILSMHKQAK